LLDWLYWIFGKILFGIDWAVFHTIGIHNTGLCIILFTIVAYLLMYPLNSKQQKSSRLMSKINPEIKAIQKKYKGKTDQASQMKMNQETQAVYAKYGISPFSGCLPLIVTLPVMYCLYRVMYDVKKYVPALAEAKDSNIFLGLNIDSSPLNFFREGHTFGWAAFLIPVLAVVLQFLNTKLMQVKTDGNQEQDSMASSMKMMNYFMPFMSGFFCLSLPMYIGLYWVAGSLFRIVQAILINRKVDSISMDDLIEKNKEKASKKNAKRAEMNKQMEEYAKKRTSTIKSASAYQNKETSDKVEDVSIEEKKNYQSGSIAGYAHMLSGKKDKK